MKKFLGVDKTLPALERPFKAATKLKGDLPTDLEWKLYPWKNSHPWPRKFISRHEKDHKIPVLICKNFWE